MRLPIRHIRAHLAALIIGVSALSACTAKLATVPSTAAKAGVGKPLFLKANNFALTVPGIQGIAIQGSLAPATNPWAPIDGAVYQSPTYELKLANANGQSLSDSQLQLAGAAAVTINVSAKDFQAGNTLLLIKSGSERYFLTPNEIDAKPGENDTVDLKFNMPLKSDSTLVFVQLNVPSSKVMNSSAPYSEVLTSGIIGPNDPGNGTFLVEGTATDIAESISFVKVAIKDVASGKYLNATEQGFTESGAVWLLTTGKGNWQLSLPTSLFIDGRDYEVDSLATSVSGQAQAVPGASRVSWKSSSPVFSALALGSDAADGWVNKQETADKSALAGELTATGYTQATYALVSGNANCPDATGYSATVPTSDNLLSASDGPYKVCVKLEDSVKNPATFGSTSPFTYKSTVPSISTVSLVNVAADGYLNNAEYQGSAQDIVAVTAASYDTLAYAVIPNGGTCGGSQSFTASVPQSNAAAFATEGTYQICVLASDAAGNPTAYLASSPLTVDETAPSITGVSFSPVLSDSYINAAEHSATSDLIASVTGTGYTSLTYAVGGSLTTCDASLTYGAAPKTSDASFSTDGSYKVCLKASDNAGNVTYFSSTTFNVKTTLPAFTSIALAGDAVDGYINASEHGHTTAMASAAVGTGYSAVDYALVASAAACNTASNYASAIPASNSADFGSDGAYKICVRLTDAASNPAAYGASATINLKLNQPTFTSLSLAGDVTDGYLNFNERANGLALASTLSGSYYDSASYAVALSTTTCDGSLTYTASIPSSLDSALNTDGTYKVCAQLQDNAGNPSAYGASPSFTYDSYAPTPGNSGTLTPTSGTGPTVSLSWTAASDEHSAQAQLKYLVYYSTSDNLDTLPRILANGTAFGSYAANITSANVTGLTSGVTYYFNVVVEDEAGNRAAYRGNGLGILGNDDQGFSNFGTSGFSVFSNGAHLLDEIGRPTGLATDATYLYVLNYQDAGLRRYNLSDGTFAGWSADATGGYTVGDPCYSDTLMVHTTDWCTSSAPGSWGQDHVIYPSGSGTMAVTATYIYAIDSKSRVMRFLVSNGTNAGWIGNIQTSPTGGDTGCAGAAVGTFTPGWCTGGVAQAGSGDGMLNNPQSIVVGGGNIYVADANNARINKYDEATGAFLGWVGYVGTTPTGGAAGCTSAAPGSSTPGWCTGGAAQSTSANLGIAGFNSPYSLAFDGTYLYVTESRVSLVKRFDASTGAFAGWIGALQGSTPTSGASGCTNSANVYTPGWCYGGSAGYVTSGDGALYAAMAIAVSGDGYLYVGDTNRLVKYVASTGAYVGYTAALMQTSPTGGASGCTSVAAGTIASSGWCTGGTVNIYAGNWYDDPSARSLGGATVSLFDSLTTDSANNIYLGDAQNGRVLKFSSAGVYQGFLGRNTSYSYAWKDSVGVSSPTNQNNTLASTALDPVNRWVYSGEGGSSIHRFNMDTGADGGWIGYVAMVPTGGDPGCTTAAVGSLTPGWCLGGSPEEAYSILKMVRSVAYANGYLYANAAELHKVQKFDATTGAFVATVESGITFVKIALDATGTYLYGTDGGGAIYKFSTSGTYVGWTGLVGTTPTGGATGCTTTSAGQVTPGWCIGGGSATGSGDGMMNGPLGLTVDGTNVYVADNGNYRIDKFDAASGAFLGWYGRVATQPTGGASGCSSTVAGQVTPGFCKGGTAQANTGDGGFGAPLDVQIYRGTYMYVFDNSSTGTRLDRIDIANGRMMGIKAGFVTATGGAANCSSGSGFTANWCTGVTMQPNSVSSSQFTNASLGISVDPDGMLYLSNYGHGDYVRMPGF